MKIYEFTNADLITAEKMDEVFRHLLDAENCENEFFDEDLYEWLIGGNVYAQLKRAYGVYPLAWEVSGSKYIGIDMRILAPGDRSNTIILDKKPKKNAIYGALAPRTEYNQMYRHKPQDLIKKVIFNDPATIVYWPDGTKTVVKAEGEAFDPEKGLAMAIAKKYLGNKGNYYNVFREWLPNEEEKIDADHEQLLTAKQLAEKMGLSVSTVLRDCRRGIHPGAKKVDGKWLIPYSGLVGGNKNDN